MKTILSKKLFVTLFFFFPLSLFAWMPTDFSVNVRAAYLHPTSSQVRKIYGNGWADYQLELATNILPNWQVWGGVSGFGKKGHSIGLEDRTHLRLIPVSLGLKYLFNCGQDLDFYVGGGLCYSFLNIKDKSPVFDEHISKRAFGFVLQSGVYYYFYECFFVNLFADYYFQRFHLGHNNSESSYTEWNDLDMSAFKAGLGIGIQF